MTKKLTAGLLSLLMFVLIATALPQPGLAATTTGTGTTTIGFSPGLLVLSSVPSFTFGLTNTVPTSSTSYTATGVVGNLLVLDERGNNAGWKLTVQMGTFQNAAYTGSDAIMPTAQLQLPSPTLTGYNGNIATAPSSLSTANMTPGEATGHSVISAAAGQGNGGWQASYTAGAVKLLVNTDNIIAGTNTANLTWTLFDAP